MANDLNRWQGIGRIGKDIDMRYTGDGKAIASFSMACGESWKNKQTGENQERTEWVNVTAFGKLAEIMGKYLSKGSQVFIEGKLRTEKYQKDGQDRYSTKVIADNMQMLGGKKDGAQGVSQATQQQTQQAQPGASGFDDFDDSTIPF